MEFLPFDAKARKLIVQYLKDSGYTGSDFSYYAYLIWCDLTEYAEKDGALFLRAAFNGKLRYWAPLLSEGVTMRHALSLLPPNSEIFSCTEELANELSDAYDASTNRDWSEYIYRASDFIAMKGKRYNAKRNHIRKFSSVYNWTMTPLKEDEVEELLQFEREWMHAHNFQTERARDSAVKESLIMKEAVLASLRGETVCEVLRVDGKLVGFSVGEIMPSNTAVVIYEKADVAYDGVYSFLAHEFAAREFASCEFINRQEDMGLEGLRRSKLSYCPEFLLDKYVLTPKQYADKADEPCVESCGEFEIKRLTERDFNMVMCFLKEEISRLPDKKNFLNYTDDELVEVLSKGYMLGAFSGDELVGTCAVDLDESYGDKLRELCGDKRPRQYYEFSGIMVRERMRGRGVAKTLCKAVIKYAEQNLAGSVLCAVVQRGNLPSLSNLEKLGFEKRGEAPFKQYDFLYLAKDI